MTSFIDRVRAALGRADDTESSGGGGPAVEGAWPMQGYVPARTGWNPNGTGPEAPVLPQWTVETDPSDRGEFRSAEAPPIVAGGTAFFGTAGGHLHAVDARTGTGRWRYELSRYSPGAATVEGEMVYVGSDKQLVALSVEDGTERWTYGTGGHVAGSPAVVDGRVVVTDRDGAVHAVDASTGEKHWRYELDGGIYAPPAVADADTAGRETPVVYVGGHDEQLHAVDLADGSPVWTADTGDSPDTAPAVARIDGPDEAGTVFVGTRVFDSSLRAYDASTGELRWQFERAGTVKSPAVAHVGGEWRVFVGTARETFHALSARTGEERWSIETPGTPGPPSVVNGTVYVGDSGDTVRALDAVDGETRWTFHTADTAQCPPAVVDGRLVVGDAAGRVYTLREATPEERAARETTETTGPPELERGWTVAGGDLGRTGDATRTDPPTQAPTVEWAIAGQTGVGTSRAAPAVVADDGPAEVGNEAGDHGAAERTDDGSATESEPRLAPAGVYAASAEGLLYALAPNGSRRWTYRLGEWTDCSPAVGHGRVYVGTPDGTVHAVDATTGDRVWTYDAEARVSADVAVADGCVYVGGHDGRLHVLDAATGERTWLHDGDGAISAGATLAAGRCVVARHDGTVTALVAGTGHEAWTVEVSDRVVAAPVTVDRPDGRTVVFGDAGGSLTAVTLADGTVQWRTDIGSAVRASPAVLQAESLAQTDSGADGVASGEPDTAGAGLVCAVTHEGRLMSVDASDGSERLNTVVEAGVVAGPLVTAGDDDAGPTAYVCTPDGLRALSLTDGAERWRLDADGWVSARLAAAQGRLYVYGGDRRLVALTAPESTNDDLSSVASGTIPGEEGAADTDATDWWPTGAQNLGRTGVREDERPTPTVARPDREATLVDRARDLSDGELARFDSGPLPGVALAAPPAGDGRGSSDDEVAVYIGFGGGIARVDAPSTEERWRFETGCRVRATPAVARIDGSETVYVATTDGAVYALASETGRQRWSREIHGKVYGSPAVRDGSVYVGTDRRRVYALDAATGSEHWRVDTDGSVESAPACAGETLVVADDETVYALDRGDGRVRWRVDAERSGAPVVRDDVVYVTDGTAVRALALTDGTERWRTDVGASLTRQEYDGTRGVRPAVTVDRVFVSTETALCALDRIDGTREWTAEFDGRSRSAPVVAGPTVFVEHDRTIRALDRADGTERWTGFGDYDTTLAVGRDRLYVAGKHTVRVIE